MVKVRLLPIWLATDDLALTWTKEYSMSDIENWLLVPILAITNSRIFCICSISHCCLWMTCCCDSYCSAYVWMSCYRDSYCSAYIWMSYCYDFYSSKCPYNCCCYAFSNPFNSSISPSRARTYECKDGIVERLLDLRASAPGTPCTWP